ncbi:unnamed protein product [Coffea canephora]|uniref:Membrane-associated kinase regulator 6 n=2 Tax=Coffea TaxID=13442 RepID=A0A068UKL1_COFCA|nr:probable membrane-associated kinase regulator 6 [Coffea arabica]CDP08744.1 unnamed protein product [Coffea canephora]
MDNSQPLATDSFSYSWLINQEPSLDGLLESLRPSVDFSNETVPMVHHLNKIFKDDQEFDFNVTPGSRSSLALVDADEIFAEGCIKPIFPNRNRTKMQPSLSVPATPLSSVSSRTLSVSSAYQGKYYSSRKWTKSSNKVLQRCFSLLKPFCQGFGWSRKSIRVDDLDRKVLEVQSRSNSQQASPDRRTAYSAANWAAVKQTSNTLDACRRLQNSETKILSNSPQASTPRSPSHYTDSRLDIESSIHEAILHCKRSFANRET